MFNSSFCVSANDAPPPVRRRNAARRSRIQARPDYGDNFLGTVVNFLIIALAIFLVVRQINAMTRKPAEQITPGVCDCPQCLSPAFRSRRHAVSSVRSQCSGAVCSPGTACAHQGRVFAPGNPTGSQNARRLVVGGCSNRVNGARVTVCVGAW
ncbi:MAG TPA: MscL family protein [Thermoanaerobaculia bacterium]